MKQFNIHIKIRGVRGTLWAPNTNNPVSSESILDVANNLSDLPNNNTLRCIAIKIEEVEDADNER